MVRGADRDLILGLGLACLWTATLEMFHIVPAIDLWIQHLFFSPVPCPVGSRLDAICGSFPIGDVAALQTVRKVLFDLPFVVTGLVLVTLAWAVIRPGRFSMPALRDMAALLATMAIGPGLIVNVFLKSYSGRPRPMQTDLFGGDMGFMAAGQFGGACHDNCSFVSGEAAGAAWLVCALVLLPTPLRRKALPIALGIAVLTSLLRVVFGRHYPSDALLGFLLTFVVFQLVRLGLRALPLPAYPSPKSHQ
ncbi:hypothetical protein BJF93_16885 [Xaviernesmea oryzae]|uniref:Phosphatidic acid phosphatase type 2/haloperoxidase domain-containing protein n=1 Tax=Xaviernesmea oryzae TaxID=464029 RepID=A0A1Q9AT96_9HYPH|nr:hypothetical protein BJF93_16885 [Xaviernesmea oryzae]